MPDLHFNRVPSLLVTDDGSARPLTEDDVAFFSAPQEADAAVAADGTVTEGAPGLDAAPAIGESGRWFRPAKAKKKYVPIPPEEPTEPGSAGLDVVPADPEPGPAVATREPPEQAAEAEAEGVFWEAAGAGPAPGRAAMIASNCERLEVFIGGTQLARPQPATRSPLYGGLAHPPFFVRLPKHLPKPVPDLLIRGFVAGQPVAELRMSAHPGGDAHAVVVDDATILADGSDATRVVFRAIDAFGNQRRYGSGQVALTLSGPAMLLGDNPVEFGEYGGLGAVWIRSLAGQPGAITLTASHPLLGQAEVQVRSAAVKNTSELG
jgi:hypothetical protein